MGQTEGSIDKKAIPTFRSAVRWVMENHWEELHSKSNFDEIDFCVSGYDGRNAGCKISLNCYAPGSNYSDTLKKSLKMIEDWATENPSEELKDFWSGSTYYPSKTCHKVVLSNHECGEMAAQSVDLKELHDILA